MPGTKRLPRPGPREGCLVGRPVVLVLGLGLLTCAACRPVRADEPGSEARPHVLTVEARDLGSDAPVPGVACELKVAGGDTLRASTDAEGIARFEYTLPEATRGRFFSVSARGEGLVPLEARWIRESSSPTPPDRLLFQTEKATTIGGRVLDEEGRPLPGAVVVVNVRKRYPESKQWVSARDDTTRTDEKGHWSFTHVPAQPDSVELGTYHPLCLTEHSAVLSEPFQPLAALRDDSAVLRLRRGTRIEGTVLAPDGQPVPDAEVFYGSGRGYGNAIPPVKTDAQGRFEIGIKPGTTSILAARATGFGPTLQPLKVGAGPEPMGVYLTLTPAHSFRGRVVDPAGNPLPQATVQLYWSGPEGTPGSYWDSAIARTLTTDRDGRFDWKEAPARGVHANVHAAGFTAQEKVALDSDVDLALVLRPPTAIRATVVDRASGQPVSGFSIRLAAAWKPGDPFIWQRGWDVEKDARRSPGSFEYTIASPAHRYLLRVQADGYRPEDSEPFAPDGSAHALTFRLTRAEPIRGTVSNPDGSPAREGFVTPVPPHREGWLQYLSLENDDVSERDRSRMVHARVGSDGRFSLLPQGENHGLLILADAGYALVSRQAVDARGQDELRLQLRPWARVRATVTLDGTPSAGLALQSHDPDDSAPVEGEPRMVRQWYLKTDAEGRFELPRVMSGRLTLVQWLPNGVNRRIWPVIRATLDVEEGESYDLKIGASGRLVRGQLALPQTEMWMIRKAEILPGDEGTNTRANRPAPIGVEILEGGRFRALDVPPGRHTLHIALHEPPPAESCGWGRLLGDYVREFTVAAGTSARDDPLDLGRLTPIEAGGRPLEVGDRAPDFALKTLEGRDLRLADFRGKYVLLDFWASWCAPCLAEMPNLRAVHDRFANDPRFVLLGISLDDRPQDAASSVKALKLPWLQGFAGPESPATAAYGATAIPATFLIGPDGTVVARGLRGEGTLAAVTEALGP